MSFLNESKFSCFCLDSKTKHQLFLAAILSASLLTAILSSCAKTTNSTPLSSQTSIKLNNNNKTRVLLYLLDHSDSSNTQKFKTQIKTVCDTLKQNIRRGDFFTQIPVSAEQPDYTSPTAISPKRLREECGQRTISIKKGTKTEYAFNHTLRNLKETKNLVPISIIHINSNEQEIPDPIETWRKTAQLVIEQGGWVLVIGATNDGAENFNTKLVSAFEGLEKVKFASSQAEIIQHINKAMKR